MATYKILDISKYQPTVDYTKVAKEIDGVILRIGLTYWGQQNMGVDPYFEQHYKGFKAVGCPVGVYYYSAADSVAVAEKEAEFCLSLMNGKQFELPVYYDVENNERQGNLSKQALTNIVDAFCSKIEKQGYFVGYYSYTAWLQSKFDTAYLSKKYTLWKADYRTIYNTSIKCDMHQYTSSGKVNGINGNVDLSRCYKDFPSIIKNAGLNGYTKAKAITYKVATDAMSAGDKKTICNQLDNLKIGYTVTEIK
ncbi:MAG: glycoside hydrolase family 25 protein [Oscillospiraceae bacterium]|nr:glycoside hydrolase family 25 protein [Oscillospiraceae bacterium]